jgi:Glycosyl transferases group 1
MKVLFINKKQKTKTWSDAIENLRLDLEQLPEMQVEGFEIDTSSFSAYFGNGKRLRGFLATRKFDVILVHHVICAWPILSIVKKQTALRILALHETEPVLGYSFLIKNIFSIPIKHWIRFSRIWNSEPINFFQYALILNRHQAIYKSLKFKYHQLGYLGVDDECFNEAAIPGLPLKGVFPFAKDRIEKGYSIAQRAIEDQNFEISLIRGGEIPYAEMPAFYSNSHFLILPTLYETYSLALLEAMASNIFVLASESIGLIDNLLLKYSKEDLASFGIFVCERTADSFSDAIKIVRNLVLQNSRARTRELLLLEGLNRRGAAQNLADVILSFKEPDGKG